MTQTPTRDWQKDMERVLEGRRILDEYGIKPKDDSLDVILSYWLQEAKKWRERYEQRPTFELLEAAQSLYEHHNARADAAEGREQQLIDLLYDTVGSLVISVGTDNEHVQRISAALRTLYPDTPAPKEGTNETS